MENQAQKKSAGSHQTKNIYSFLKNDSEKVQIALKKFRDNYFVDFRIWFEAENKSFLPTKRGVYFPLEYLGEFKKGIDALSTVAQRLKPVSKPDSGPGEEVLF